MNKYHFWPTLRKGWYLLVIWLIAVCWWQTSISEHLFFGFEQGRDALVVESISTRRDFVLVGPKTDIGGVFHGAWFYYLMVIPYSLGQGNPLVASGFLIGLTALTPVLLAWFISRILQDWRWGALAGLVAIASFDMLSYSRWLSNVTPALLLVPLTFYSLWEYRQTKRGAWWLLAVTMAVLSSQFEIILSLWWGWVFGVLLLSRWLPWPSLKNWIAAVGIGGFFFAPMIIFNIRNEWISLHGAQQYLHDGKETSTGFNLLSNAQNYFKQLTRLWERNLIGISPLWSRVSFVVVGLGVLKVWVTQTKLRSTVALLLLWTTMTVGVLLFPRSLSLPQLYVGSGVAMIGLTVLGMYGWWQWKLGKVVVVGLILLLCFNLQLTAMKVLGNHDVFFKTIQDDLNYRDQKQLLAYIHQDALGTTYAWKAFAIPYFQEEGWQYLHRYWYPNDSTDRDHAEIIYLIIEKPVDPYWVKVWTGELGKTELLETKSFGLLKVEKRRRVSS